MKCVKVEHPKSTFDPRSFRTLVRGNTRILVGCPKGEWQPRLERCRVGMRAYEVIKLNATSCTGRGRRRRR